ncbi:hypothetical protein [Thermococcus sp. GR6]|uniref:hypothetical protein n=1 Tax=Thermococcus sp. GR6 TaxID=1638256 RepID=UPI001431D33F|nr:hypothetical protein [Thermococcus sp. GR6]NJE42474.1 hypothetical protein [Thermococcus sp. GR6]
MQENEKVEDLVVSLLGAIDGLVDWSSMGDKVRKKKYSILAKRIAVVAKSSNNLNEFVEKLLSQVAGDSLFVSREQGEKFRKIYMTAKDHEKDVLEFLKNYPYLSTVLYAAYVEGLGGDKK